MRTEGKKGKISDQKSWECLGKREGRLEGSERGERGPKEIVAITIHRLRESLAGRESRRIQKERFLAGEAQISL